MSTILYKIQREVILLKWMEINKIFIFTSPFDNGYPEGITDEVILSILSNSQL